MVGTVKQFDGHSRKQVGDANAERKVSRGLELGVCEHRKSKRLTGISTPARTVSASIDTVSEGSEP